MQRLCFLLLEDSELDVELIRATLTEGGVDYHLTHVQTRAEFLAALEAECFDLILSDYSLPDFDGISALEIAHNFCPETPFIFVSATLGEELAIEALKNGATDYVLKHRLKRLVPSVERALREAQERRNYQVVQQQREQAEEALRRSEARFRRLVESNLIGCIFWDIEGNILDANDAFLSMVGYTREDLEAGNMSWRAMTPPEHVPLSEQSIAKMRGTGFSDKIEKEYLRKDGTRVPVLLGGVMFENSQDQGVSFVVDLSERKRTEKILQERNERLKLLFETTSDLLSTEQPLTLLNSLFKKLSAQMDLHYYFNFLVERQGNRQVLRLRAYGGVSEEAAQALEQIELGQYMCGQVAKDRCQIVLNDVQRSLHPHAELIRSIGIQAYSGQPLIVQGRLLGSLSFASTTRTSFTLDEVALLQATSDQIAIALERAELTASLQQQTERLIQANQIKDEFLAVLSHELRTPLNPILGWSRMLQRGHYDEATTTRALETIERNARIQTQLIDDLLDVSRILRGKLSLNNSQVNLVQTVEAALETVRLSAEAKGIQVSFIVDAGGEEQGGRGAEEQGGRERSPSLMVLGDSGRLQQVVWNLLSNAVKFTPVDGSINVCLSVINRVDKTVSEKVDEPMPTRDSSTVAYAQIQVSDTGRGISPEFLPYVFDYFRQADGSTTRMFGGLGLGLAIANHIIQAHGGILQVESAGEGQGATFTVRLPLLRETKPNSKDENLDNLFSMPPQSPLLRNLKALIVDDEKDTLDLIAFLLEERGAVVAKANCVSEALSIFDSFQPDILISDIGMPQEDGYSLMRKIRTQVVEEKRNIPAIALTAYARDEDRHRVFAVGFQKYMPKPVDPQDFITTVVELIERETVKAGGVET